MASRGSEERDVDTGADTRPHLLVRLRCAPARLEMCTDPPDGASTAEGPGSVLPSDVGEEIELHPWRAYTIGRSRTADIHVDNERVSRVHATILYHDGWVISDANSANHTLVSTVEDVQIAARNNGVLPAQRVDGERRRLHPGDVVVLGTRSAVLEILGERRRAAGRSTTDDDRVVSEAARTFERALDAAARHAHPVFLLGNTGAGKTHAARRIHDKSARRNAPFIVVNCASLPHDPSQLRSVLFGHLRGAYTDARQSVLGKVYQADGGTLFLDEVESLHPIAQGFLLDVMERGGDLAPLGAEVAPKAPDVRVIAASKRPLSRSGLRQDLCYRLAAGDNIVVPSLADRREDIAGLSRAFLDEEAGAQGVRARLAPEAITLLERVLWPGEIRQLRTIVSASLRSAIGARGSLPPSPHELVVVGADDVSARLELDQTAHGAPPTNPFDEPNDTRHDLRAVRSVIVDERATLPAAAAGDDGTFPPVGAEREPSVSTSSVNPRRLTKELVEKALAATGGNIEHAAKQLGIARRTLMAKMDAFGIARARR